MKQIEKTTSATNFDVINLGKLNELGNYVLELTPEIKIPGKVFCGSALQVTGSEFSFSYSYREQKQDFFTLTKHMKNFIFSLVEMASFR